MNTDNSRLIKKVFQIRSSIPIEWTETLKRCSLMPKNIPSGNIIKINNKMKAIEKVTCKEFYWHLINIDVHNSSSVRIWSSQYLIFVEASTNVWPRIFKLPFITVRDTKIQTFQYRLIQKDIPCNTWLHNIKIKNCSVCDYCMNVDDFPHFFIRCLKVKEFWLHWFNWWEHISGIVIRNSQVIEECILFGFPSNSDVMQVLNFLYYMQNIISIANVYLIITHLISIPA